MACGHISFRWKQVLELKIQIFSKFVTCVGRLWECPGTCFRREYSTANHNHYSNDLPFGLHWYNARRKVGNQPWLKQVSWFPHAYIDVREAHAPQIVNNFGPGMQLRRRHSTPRWDHKCRCSTVKNGRGKVIVSFVFYRTISGLFALMERIVSLMKTEWGTCRCLVLPGQVVMCRGLSVGTTAHTTRPPSGFISCNRLTSYCY